MSEARQEDGASAVENLDLDLDLDTDDGVDAPELDVPLTPEERVQPAAPPSREARTIARLRRERQEAQEQARQARADHDRAMQLLQRQQYQPPPDPYRHQQEQQAENERLMQMDPVSMARYLADKARQESSREIMEARVWLTDHMDRQAFERIKSEEPQAARLADQVETAMTNARARGLPVTREEVYGILLAREIRTKAKADLGRQRQRGAARVAAQTTQPGGTSSTVPAPRRGEKRAEDITEAELLERIGDHRI